MEITKELAEKVLQVVDHGLVVGLGQPIPGQMCVEAAVCYAMGLPHSDRPSCVYPPLGHLKIHLNDTRIWRDKAARAKGLRRLAIAQLGTMDQQPGIKGFITLVREHVINVLVPKAISDELFTKLQISKTLCENFRGSSALGHVASFIEAVKKIRGLEFKATIHEQELIYALYNLEASFDETWPFIAVEGLANGACRLVRSGKLSNCESPSNNRVNQEKQLMEFCEAVVQILVKMETPGSKFLYLTE